MNGTVIFSKDFLKKTKTNITHKQKGNLRIEKIAEAERSGQLSLAKNRIEVAEIVGIPKNQPAVANAWVYRQIKIGKLTETLVKFDEHNKPEYEYHYYENKIAKPFRPKKKIETVITPEVIKKVKPAETKKVEEPVKEKKEIIKEKKEVVPVAKKQETPAEVNIPLSKDLLENGFSLTLNINFTINK